MRVDSVHVTQFPIGFCLFCVSLNEECLPHLEECVEHGNGHRLSR